MLQSWLLVAVCLLEAAVEFCELGTANSGVLYSLEPRSNRRFRKALA